MAPRDGVGGVCVCVCEAKAPPLQPHVPLLTEDRILPERTVCPSQLPYCLNKTGANWREKASGKDAIPMGSPPAAAGIV